jgi:hypothetical protein
MANSLNILPSTCLLDLHVRIVQIGLAAMLSAGPHQHEHLQSASPPLANNPAEERLYQGMF